MKRREEIIEDMCLTWRHDYGIVRQVSSIAGMTEEERSALSARMGQIFDNNIAPHMEFRKEPRRTELVHDGIIKIHSFELTEREKKRIAMGLKYGPAAAAMKDDGTFWESQASDGDGWLKWIGKKFLGRS